MGRYIEFSKLVGKKIIAFRGIKNKKEAVELRFVLFDDNETVLEFIEQDRYEYHDCNNAARIVALRANPELWKRLYERIGSKKWRFVEPTNLSEFPFC